MKTMMFSLNLHFEDSFSILLDSDKVQSGSIRRVVLSLSPSATSADMYINDMYVHSIC